MSGLFTHNACTEQHRLQAGDTLALTSPSEVDGVKLFQRTLYLQIPLDNRCRAVQLAPQSQLKLRFAPTTIEVNGSNDDWMQTWVANNERVEVELTYPAPILRLRSQLYGKIAVHRVDGEAVSEQPTVTANAGQLLPEPLLATAFQVVLSNPIADKHARAVADKIAQRHAGKSSSRATALKPETAPSTSNSVLQQIHEELLVQSGLSSIQLLGQPANPRLRLLNSDRSEELWQWLEAAPQTETVIFPSPEEELCKLLAPALKRALEQDEGKSDFLVLPLLMENDAPCLVTVEAASITFLLETELINEAVDFHFAGNRTETLRTSLDLPSGTPQSLAFAGNLSLTPPSWLTTPPPLAPGSERTGISLAKGDMVGVSLNIEQPLKLSGLAVAWYNLAEETRLRLSICRDSDNRPAAKTLSDGNLTETVDRPQWLHFRLAETALQPGLYWIKLRLLEGNGIWLGQPLPSPQNLWQESRQQTEQCRTVPLQLYTFPLSSPLATEETAVIPLQAGLHGTPLPHATTDTNHIAGELKEIPPALQALAAWDFEITSGQSLNLTLKSIRLSYTL
ncbi:MAG: hypothetical protein P8X63_06145 [Desulfuromonadaceae bacterium]